MYPLSTWIPLGVGSRMSSSSSSDTKTKSGMLSVSSSVCSRILLISAEAVSDESTIRFAKNRIKSSSELESADCSARPRSTGVRHVYNT
jgi:hypothetical protein